MRCNICGLSKTEEAIYETRHWKVILNKEQSYLGRCVIILKRHAGELPNLTQDEYEEFFVVIKKLEPAIKKAFGAEMFNWTCLMNNAYQRSPPDPHVHWHLRPRYNHTVKFAGAVFKDTEFGHHYGRNRKFEVSEEIKQKIIRKIKENL